MRIKDIQEEIVEEFSMFDDWMQRYEYMIELGKSLPLIDDKYKTDDNLIKGCQSKVWVHAELQGESCALRQTAMLSLPRGSLPYLSGRSPGRPRKILSMPTRSL